MQGYVRCSGIFCWSASTGVFEDVPLCAEHLERITTALRTVEHVVEESPPHGLVYYATWQNCDTVKIGTTQNLARRLGSLNKTYRNPARIMVAEPGGYYLETKRHRQFAHLRLSGSEMFRWVPQLAEHIAALREQHPNWRDWVPVSALR